MNDVNTGEPIPQLSGGKYVRGTSPRTVFEVMSFNDDEVDAIMPKLYGKVHGMRWERHRRVQRMFCGNLSSELYSGCVSFFNEPRLSLRVQTSKLSVAARRWASRATPGHGAIFKAPRDHGAHKRWRDTHPAASTHGHNSPSCFLSPAFRLEPLLISLTTQHECMHRDEHRCEAKCLIECLNCLIDDPRAGTLNFPHAEQASRDTSSRSMRGQYQCAGCCCVVVQLKEVSSVAIADTCRVCLVAGPPSVPTIQPKRPRQV